MSATVLGTPRTSPARSSWLALLVAAVALLLGVGVAVAPAAWAHADLVSTDPADGATLDAAPDAVTLTFSDTVLPAGSQVVAAGPDGSRVTLPTTVSGTSVAAAWPPDAAGGQWTVDWRVVAADGHTLTGTVRFTYPSSPSSPASPDGSGTPTADPEPGLVVESGDVAASEPAVDASASPVSAQEESGTSSSTVILLGVAALLAVAAGVLWVVARRSG